MGHEISAHSYLVMELGLWSCVMYQSALVHGLVGQCESKNALFRPRGLGCLGELGDTAARVAIRS